MADNNITPDEDIEAVEVEELNEEGGAGCLSSAGTASCPASLGTAACW